mmetsp:Transcript_16515/g.39311  ORF Transcript_16515/g.39311 Transcript_16515/m.39311 type:complete len:147 (+) Transcript_16515:2-442(+)
MDFANGTGSANSRVKAHGCISETWSTRLVLTGPNTFEMTQNYTSYDFGEVDNREYTFSGRYSLEGDRVTFQEQHRVYVHSTDDGDGSRKGRTEEEVDGTLTFIVDPAGAQLTFVPDASKPAAGGQVDEHWVLNIHRDPSAMTKAAK